MEAALEEAADDDAALDEAELAADDEEALAEALLELDEDEHPTATISASAHTDAATTDSMTRIDFMKTPSLERIA